MKTCAIWKAEEVQGPSQCCAVQANQKVWTWTTGQSQTISSSLARSIELRSVRRSRKKANTKLVWTFRLTTSSIIGKSREKESITARRHRTPTTRWRPWEGRRTSSASCLTSKVCFYVKQLNDVNWSYSVIHWRALEYLADCVAGTKPGGMSPVLLSENLARFRSSLESSFPLTPTTLAIYTGIEDFNLLLLIISANQIDRTGTAPLALASWANGQHRPA